MDDAKQELVASWMSKALADLQSARKLAAPPEPQIETATYHCQQAAEKALKAYLLFRDHDLIRTHDLALLVNECASSDADFLELLDDADDLAPYATRFRYPGPNIPAEADEYSRAISIAQRIFDFVASRLVSG